MGKKSKVKSSAERANKKRLKRKGKSYSKATPPGMSLNRFKFWVLHGVNYLALPLEEAIWDPLFPEIYDGRLVEDPGEISRRVQDRFPDWGPRAEACVRWAVTSKPALAIYVREVERRAGKGVSTLPANPEVWEVFEGMVTLHRKETSS